MEDGKEILNVHDSSLQEVKESTTEEGKPIEIEEHANTEQCDPVAELDNPHLLGDESPRMATRDEAVAVESGDLMSVPEVEDAPVVGSESPNSAKGDGADDTVREVENSIADTGMDTKTGVVKLDGSGEKSVPELVDSDTEVGAASLIGNQEEGDDEVVAEENSVSDIVMETSTETVTVNNSGGNCVPELVDAKTEVGAASSIGVHEEGHDEATKMKKAEPLDDEQAVGFKAMVGAHEEGRDEAVKEKNFMADAETETDTVTFKSSDPLQGAGADLDNVGQEEGDHEALTRENPVAGSEMETEMEIAKRYEANSVWQLDNVEAAFAESPSSAPQGVDEATEKENPVAGFEMETELTKKDEANSVEELDSAGAAVAESPSAAQEEGNEAAVVYENPWLDTEMEIRQREEANSIQELDDAQLGGTKSPVLAKDEFEEEVVVEGGSPTAETKMEAEVAEDEVTAAETEMGTEVAGDEVRAAESEIEAEEAEDESSTAETEEEAEDEIPIAENEGEAEAEMLTAEAEMDAEEAEEEEIPTAETEMEAEEEEIPTAETEVEAEEDVAEKGGGSGGKRKRGRSSRVSMKVSTRKTIEEDVCFICFDGGDLVLCDRRGCPKAYHPSCVNRDEAFFRAKGRWNCGWHLCSNCEKNAHYMCLTCTFSLCKGCIKDSVLFCVRGNKGFCETCMKTVMLIESNQQGNKEALVDFDDKSSWEYLFKDYWIDLKAKLSLSYDELCQAKNPRKGSDVLAGKKELSAELYAASNDGGSGSDNSENLETASKSKRRKVKRRLRSHAKEEDVPSTAAAFDAEGTVSPSNTVWASRELLAFVMHMKDGDGSILSQFDVQALLLEYIKTNKLRDPRRKSQIICDSRLESLFGKPRVGHFEMLKLLESHFLIKEDSQTDDVQGAVVDTEANQLEADGNLEIPVKGGKDKRRKTRRKGDDRGPQLNVHDYAAIDIHNITFIYLRRKLIEDLIVDIDNFHHKVVGTFVRIRISGSNQRQELYRLVQVVGTTQAAEPYKIGKRTTDIMLQILNLDKIEVISIDSISNQEFTEDECKRLRQSIKCGLLNRLTVGDILEKATEIQEARVSDWLESEILRLSHLCDRASEKGRRKELRECVEKLQLLKTPEERRRRLEEIPEIHSDPKMDPSYESEEDDSEKEARQQELFLRPRGSGYNRQGRELISPQSGSYSSNDSWSARMNSSKSPELRRNMSGKGHLNKGEETTLIGEVLNENERSYGRDGDKQQSNNSENANSAITSESVRWNSLSVARSESGSGAVPEPSPASHSAELAEAAPKVNETEKMWHYQDPSGKVQGPFSIVQLRKWNNSGYFPPDLRIWRSTEKQENSILLTDALAGKFHIEAPLMENNSNRAQTIPSPNISSTHVGNPYSTSLQKVEPNSSNGLSTPSVEVSKLSTNSWSSESGGRRDLSNLPSPTPKQNSSSWTGEQTLERRWSPTFAVQQVGSGIGTNSFTGQNVAVQSLGLATLDNGQSAHSSASSSQFNHSGNGGVNAAETLGVPASGGHLMRGPGNDISSLLTGINSILNPGQVIHAGSANSLPSSQPNVAAEASVVHPLHGTQVEGSGSIANVERVASLSRESQGSGNIAAQNLDQSSSIPVPGQPAYGQWGVVPTPIQNPAGSVSTPGYSALPPPDSWRPPVPGNQPNIQSPAPFGTPWGMGVTENSNMTPGPRPDNPNTGWGAVPVNPNMNWGAFVQVPAPVNPNPGWFAAPGNPGATLQGPAPGSVNPGWVAMPGNPGAPAQVLAPGNVNPVWSTPTGNPGTTVQGPPMGNGNPGWNMSTGNPGAAVQGPAPGIANQGWGSPTPNQGTWGGEQQNNGDRFSRQRDRGSHGGDSGFGGGRHWNRHSSGDGGQGGSFRSFHRGRFDMLCPYNMEGRCKKGSRCEYIHK